MSVCVAILELSSHCRFKLKLKSQQYTKTLVHMWLATSDMSKFEFEIRFFLFDLILVLKTFKTFLKNCAKWNYIHLICGEKKTKQSDYFESISGPKVKELNGSFSSLCFLFSFVHSKPEERKEQTYQKWLEEKILSFDFLIDYIPPPPHVQHPVIGASLWDNRLKQVLERGRQSGARDVIREDMRASNWAECFPAELVLSMIFPLNIPHHSSSFLACFNLVCDIFVGLTNIWSHFYANCIFLETEYGLLELLSACTWSRKLY